MSCENCGEDSKSASLACYVAVSEMLPGQMFYDDDGYLWRKADGCWAVRIAGGKPWIFSRFAKWRLAT